MASINDGLLRGPPAPEANPASNGWFVHRLMALAQEELTSTGDRDWMVDVVSGASVRLSDISPTSRRVAASFSRLGVKPGEKVHVALTSRLDFYWPVFGTWLCGGVVSVGDPNLVTNLLSDQLSNLKPTLVVTSRTHLAKFLAAAQLLEERARVQILVMDAESGTSLPEGAVPFDKMLLGEEEDCPDPSDLGSWSPKLTAVVHWSSGTTGKPKGILHSQGYLHYMLKTSKLPRGTVSFNSNIFFHQGAFLLPFDGGLFNGFTCCFIREEEFSSSLVLDMMAKYKTQFYMCGLNHFTAISNEERGDRDLSSMICVMPAGGGVSNQAVARMRNVFPSLKFAFIFYGSSEVSGVSGTVDESTLGSLLPGVEVYIGDRKTGKRLGPGEHGEIMARTPTMMQGYLNRPQESAEFLDKDGFAHMGDIGYYDDKGLLYFVARAKDMLKVDSAFFSPLEVEEVLEAMTEVEESAVWGSTDSRGGNDLVNVALVVKKGSLVRREEVVAKVAASLHPRKQITGQVVFLDSIPHNPQGKKLRHQLKETYSRP